MLQFIISICPKKPKKFKAKVKQAKHPDKLNEKLTYLATVQISREVSNYFYYPKFLKKLSASLINDWLLAQCNIYKQWMTQTLT